MLRTINTNIKRRVHLGKTSLSIGSLFLLSLAAMLIGGGVLAARLGSNSSFSSGGNTDLQKGLIGWWKLDGDGKDGTPYSRPAAPFNSPTYSTDRKGMANKSLATNGLNSYMAVPSNADFKYTGGNMSVSVWFKANPGETSVGYLLSKPWNSNGGYNYQLVYNGGNNTVQFMIQGATGYTQPSYTVIGTGWHHAVVTLDSSSNVKLYVDGQLARSTTHTIVNWTPPSGDLNHPLLFGTLFPYGQGWAGNSAYTFDGLIDDVRLYNRSVNAAEAMALYESYESEVRAGSGLDGLVGHWKLDGNAKDSTPFANHGILNGPVSAVDRKGKVNGAYTFDGNDSIMIPDSPVFDIGSQGMTYTAWIKPTDFSKTYSMFMGHHLPYFNVRNTRVLHFSLTAGGTQRSVLGSTQLQSDQWYHVAATYDNEGYMRVYLNGVEDGVAGPYGAVTNYGYNQYIGHWNGSVDGYNFTGSLDELRIYNRALTLAEIVSQYGTYDSQINLNSAPTGGSSNINLYRGLVGHWPFNGNTKDATPYSNVAAITGSVLTPDRKGRPNSAYSFDGSSTYLEIPSQPVYNGATLTVSAWINTAIPTSLRTAVARYNNSSPVDGSWVLGNGSLPGTFRFMLRLGGANVEANTSGTYTTGIWRHLVGVYNGSHLLLYIDGSLAATQPISGSLPSLTEPIRVGNRNGNVSYWQGSIDDVGMWTRALSEQEITSLGTSYK